MAKKTPVVHVTGDFAQIDQSSFPEGHPLNKYATVVGSAKWEEILERGEITSFRFQPKDARLPSYLVRREIRKGGNQFWYAFKQTQDGLSKKYLGNFKAVTYEKLTAIAFDFAGIVALPRQHYLDELSRPEEFKQPVQPQDDLWQKLNDLNAENQKLIADNSAINMEVILLERQVKEQKQQIEQMRKIHQMYKLTRMDQLIAVEAVITQWNQAAEGKRAKYDRSWGKALNLLRELTKALES